jgi:diguanylate cyclase (GGDEF)-like protein
MIIILFCSAAWANQPIDLSHGWEYRMGDNLLWAVSPGKDADWQKIDFPSNPPERSTETNVWYRVQLPNNSWRDPALYITSVDLICQVYLDGNMVYSFGKFDKKGQGKFSGWPWHLISMPENYANKYLYFRIYSDASDIGLWGDITLGSRFQHLKNIFNYNNLFRLIIGCLAMFAGLGVLAAFLFNLREKMNLFLGLLLFTQGLDLAVSAKMTLAYFFYPLTFQYLLAFCYFFLPVGVAAYMESVTGAGRFQLVRRIWQIHLLYLLSAISISLMGVFNLSSTYEPFDKLYYFFSMPVLLIYSVIAARQKGTEAKMLFAGYFVLVLSYLQSTLTASGLIDWAESETHLALFFFLSMMCAITIRRYSHSKTLEEKNIALAKVKQQLQDQNRKLETLSKTDALTKLYNRLHMDTVLNHELARAKRHEQSFSVIMVDFDKFKNINDTYGHQAGDTVLAAVGDILRSLTRESDIAGRWGGEEFLVILPETDCVSATTVAEKLRSTIASYNFSDIPPQTASFGIATYKDGDHRSNIVSRADKAMYMAKSRGGNCVESEC